MVRPAHPPKGHRLRPKTLRYKGQTGRSSASGAPPRHASAASTTDRVFLQEPPVPKQTPLHAAHVAAGARMVDFAGWDMPVNYGSQIEEHHAVRRDAGMFDVSHMLALDLDGPDATTWLRGLLANDVAKLKEPGKALYSCMLNPEGGVIDDLIVYYFSSTSFRIVVNAGTADKDVAWMRQRIAVTGANVTLDSRRDLAMIAVQGPNARTKTWQALPQTRAASEGLKIFAAAAVGELLVARTGYTGEDGFELTLPAGQAEAVWSALAAAGVKPCGLGARDTLRLEAGMNLFGQDMDDAVSPLDAGLAWTVDLSDTARDFVGKDALLANPATRRVLGLILEDKGVLRSHMTVFTAHGDGETTSGSFSPSLEKSIAFARLPLAVAAGDAVEVDIRGRRLKARTVPLPFVRNGRVLV
ncbi:glycine cleavage system protein T [Azoarcus sp. DN11]|nr:glycine cleavage system protein T [Azoarcus sp. DN11]